MKFPSLNVVLHSYKSTIRPCMEYCCLTWISSSHCYVGMLGKLLKRICKIVGPALTTFAESSAEF